MSVKPRQPAGRWRRSPGFTLAEALLACVILAMVSSAIVVPFAAGARSEQDGARRTVALSLAEDLMEEILAKPFKDPEASYEEDWQTPGPGTGETYADRSTLDNIDDYHGLIEPVGTIQPAMTSQASDPLASEMSRLVKIAYVHLPGQDPHQAPNVCQVVVRVFWKDTELVRLSRLVHDYGGDDDDD